MSASQAECRGFESRLPLHFPVCLCGAGRRCERDHRATQLKPDDPRGSWLGTDRPRRTPRSRLVGATSTRSSSARRRRVRDSPLAEPHIAGHLRRSFKGATKRTSSSSRVSAMRRRSKTANLPSATCRMSGSERHANLRVLGGLEARDRRGRTRCRQPREPGAWATTPWMMTDSWLCSTSESRSGAGREDSGHRGRDAAPRREQAVAAWWAAAIRRYSSSRCR